MTLSIVPTPPPAPAWFQALYDEHLDFVLRCLARFGVPAAARDDAAQEVFITVYRRHGDFVGGSELRGWLWGIARRVAADARRTERRAWRRREVFQPPRAEVQADEQVRLRQAADRVEEFMQTLSAEQRDVFFLMHVEGWTAPEVAAAVGAKLPAIYARERAARLRFAEVAERWRRETGVAEERGGPADGS
jgi:RNA polymerase sigma-70 factor (ECF subfamily)